MSPLRTLAISLLLAAPAVAQVGKTTFTNAAGNGLWGDGRNWTNGVPTASVQAEIKSWFGSLTVDLGGISREAAYVDLGSTLDGALRVVNGALVTSSVDVGPVGNTIIDANLIGLGGTLALSGDGIINGQIGDPTLGAGFELVINSLANLQLYGVARHAGDTRIYGWVTMAESSGIESSDRIIVGRDGNLSTSAISDDATVEMFGGRFYSSGDRIARLHFSSGLATTAPGSSAAEMTRESGAVAFISAGTGAHNRFKLDVLPVTHGDGASPTRLPIIPWVAGQFPGTRGVQAEAVFLTYDRGFDPNDPADDFGLRPLHPINEFSSTLTPGANVRLLNAHATSDVEVNSLTVDSFFYVNANVKVTSGAMMFHPGNVIGTGNLDLGPEAIIQLYGWSLSNPYTIEVPVSGGTLTCAGSGTLVLTKANHFTGGTYMVNSGIKMATAQSIGPGPITFERGKLTLTTAMSLANEIIVPSGSDGYITMSGGATGVLSGNIGGDGTLFLGGPLHLSGGGSGGNYILQGSNVFLDGVFRETGASLTSPSAGRIGGDGEFHGAVTLYSGTLSPGAEGNAVGDLLLGSASVTSTAHFDLAGTEAGIEHDQLSVLRALALSGPLELALGYSPAYYDSFMIIDSRFGGPITGTFKDLGEGASFLAAGHLWQITYVGGNGNDVVITVVPEPAILIIALVSVGILASRCRRCTRR
jgi:autotransporter-associated beta strand protein